LHSLAPKLRRAVGLKLLLRTCMAWPKVTSIPAHPNDVPVLFSAGPLGLRVRKQEQEQEEEEEEDEDEEEDRGLRMLMAFWRQEW
jgi:hypothetical protein